VAGEQRIYEGSFDVSVRFSRAGPLLNSFLVLQPFRILYRRPGLKTIRVGTVNHSLSDLLLVEGYVRQLNFLSSQKGRFVADSFPDPRICHHVK
jgi:hypothetical protein